MACDGEVTVDADSSPADGSAAIDADHDGWPEDTDCDDNNAVIYPGAAAAACDTTDYNCDGQPDAVDADGDGWLSCEECDDLDASAAPDLAEICGDFADNDCDGTANDCRQLGAYELGDATATLSSWAYGQAPGGVTGLGDVDGDGIGDFVVGNWAASPSGVSDEGAAYVVRGGGPFPDELEDAWAVVEGTSAYMKFGQEFRGGTDLSGDGVPDFLVEASGGITYLVATLAGGRATAEGASIAVGDGEGYFTTIRNSGPASGDVTGDGAADLVFWGYAAEVVSLDIVSGPVNTAIGLGDWKARIVKDLTSTTCSASDGSGDMNADGVADIAVGCDRWDAVEHDAYDEGGGFVMLGPLAGSYIASVDADVTFVGEPHSSYVGRELAFAGDLNADGYSDLAFSGQRDGITGEVYVFSGPLVGRLDLAAANALLTGEEALGTCIANAGDIDRDGRSDLLLGDSRAGGHGGVAWLQYGPMSGSLTFAEADTLWSGEDGYYAAGIHCAGPGDVTGDGGDDLLVTSFARDRGEDGYVFVLEGVGL